MPLPLLPLPLQVLNRGAARCWSSETYNPVPGVLEDPLLPSNRGYKAGEI
jgi:3-hydroxyisobutyrate dehydrogenase